MARAKSNGNGRLEDALATLVQNQALLVQTQAAFVARMAETDARMAETNRLNAERFGRIEALLDEHGRILQSLSAAIRDLPDVFRARFGFKPPAES